MLATELLFVYVYCLVDGAIKARLLVIPRRPGPAPACTDGELLPARFDRDAAHAEWFYGFRLATRTDLGRRIVRAWSIVPAAVDERTVGTDLVAWDAASIDAVLQDKGFSGSRLAGGMAAAGIEVIIPPARGQRKMMPRTLQRLIARYRNRVETSFNEITDQMELARTARIPSTGS